MKVYKYLFILIPFLIIHYVEAQVPVGKWRDHFSYKKTSTVADAGDKVFAASVLALFSVDKEDGSIEKLSKVNGLSDSEIQRIDYDKNSDALLIIYQNSNIDILMDNTIYNLSDLKRKQISSDKTVYNVCFIGQKAFLACGFGIVVIDMDRIEFKDTYYIGENASYVKVNDIAVYNGVIYAATDEGLFSAEFKEESLSDFRNWNLITGIPNNTYPFNLVHGFSNKLFANQLNPITENDTLYEYFGGIWQISNIFRKDNLRSITDNGSYIVFTNSSNINTYDIYFNEENKLSWFSFSQDDISIWPQMNYGLTDENNELYIADERYGLVYTSEGILNFAYPPGPNNDISGRIIPNNNQMIITNGSNSGRTWMWPVYNIFENEEWYINQLSVDTARNFFSITVNPQNDKDIFIGTWGYGIFEFVNNQFINHYFPGNSSLQNISGYSYGYARIPSLVFDKNSNLWVSNQQTGEPISVKTSDGQWHSFNFDGLITNYMTDDIIVLENNQKWALLGEGNGVLVLDDNNTPLNEDDDTFKKLYPKTSEGDVFKTVYAIVQDKNDYVWLGTEEGVLIYYDTENVFDNDFYADRVQLTSYGNDTTEQYLLSTDIITDIEVDGADRKWISTQSSGVFLISENGKEEILHFNQYNSPLISNNITDIGINPVSGEVFFITDKGVLSYRSDATEGGDVFGNVYVFPNPVRPGFEGVITVTGLADGVNVKITDISGNLVYDTDALGGQATWDGKTFDGRKVNSGVYLVFCSNEDGSQTYVTKFLYMN